MVRLSQLRHGVGRPGQGIKEAEKKAETIISDAKQNAKEIVSNATKEADIKYDEIVSGLVQENDILKITLHAFFCFILLPFYFRKFSTALVTPSLPYS